jgi:hypothetical protein
VAWQDLEADLAELLGDVRLERAFGQARYYSIIRPEADQERQRGYQKRFRQSSKGAAVAKRYAASELGRASQAARDARYRAKRRALTGSNTVLECQSKG